MSDSGIEIAELSKSFGGKKAVDGVSFAVTAGSIVGLLGPNGAGKTTVINCLSTLLRPDAGRAVVAGHEVTSDPAAVRGSIALTGQFAAVDEVLTGRQNLVLFGRLLRLGRRRARERAGELLTRFALADAADEQVKSYSGGMRRRLDLAASLVVERPVVFLDEPTTGLDPRSRQAMWDVVADLRAAGVTILLTTQYLEEADRLADRIVVLDRGKVIADGTPGELKSRVGGVVCAVHVADDDERERALDALRKVSRDVTSADGVITVPDASAKTLTQVVAALEDAGIEPDDVALRRPSLDEVFFALTGHGAEREEVTA